MGIGGPRRHVGTAALLDARKGAAAIEFALVSLFLFTLLTGVVSLGVGLYVAMEVQNAARAGAAYAASRTYDKAAIETAAQGATALGSLVAASAARAPSSCLNQATGAISSAGSASTCPDSGAKPATYVTVTTQMTYSPILPLPQAIGTTMLLRGKSVTRMP